MLIKYDSTKTKKSKQHKTYSFIQCGTIHVDLERNWYNWNVQFSVSMLCTMLFNYWISLPLLQLGWRILLHVCQCDYSLPNNEMWLEVLQNCIIILKILCFYKYFISYSSYLLAVPSAVIHAWSIPLKNVAGFFRVIMK